MAGETRIRITKPTPYTCFDIVTNSCEEGRAVLAPPERLLDEPAGAGGEPQDGTMTTSSS